MSDADLSNRQTSRLLFTGTALALFGRYLATVLGSVLVVPAPWLTTWFVRWFLDKTDVEDGTELRFEGKAGEVWVPMMLLVLLGLAGSLPPDLISAAMSLSLPFLLIPLNALLLLMVVRWYVGGSRLDGRPLHFEGTYWALLGYYLLSFLSVFTIIGWAWVLASAIRWYYRNIAGDFTLDFAGRGHQILWRTIVCFAPCMLIIPIPWMFLWFSKWYLSESTVQRSTSTAQAEPSSDESSEDSN